MLGSFSEEALVRYNASYDDLVAVIPKKVLKRVLGWDDKDLAAIEKGTDPYEASVIDDGEGNYRFYGAA